MALSATVLGVALGLVPTRRWRLRSGRRRAARRSGGLGGVVLLLSVSLAAQPVSWPVLRGGPGPGKSPLGHPLNDDEEFHRELVRRDRRQPGDGPRLEAIDTRVVAQLTGPESANQTDQRWHVFGTDLGHMFWHAGRLYVVFGDTFGPAFGTDWRSSTMAWVDDPDPAEGLRFSGMVTDDAGRAAELLPSQKVHGVEMTVIPTYGFSLGDRMVLHYMSVKHWETPGRWVVNYSGLAYSDDSGRAWVKHPTARWSGDSNFAQVAAVTHDGYLYLFGIPAGRFGGVQLARVRPDEALSIDRYGYWTGSSWAADPGRAATVVPAPAGELSVAWSSRHRLWLMLHLDVQRHGVVLRTAGQLTGPWSAPHLVVSAVDHPQVYAPYIVPTGLDQSSLYFTVSRYDPPYDVFLMRTTLWPRPPARTPTT